MSETNSYNQYGQRVYQGILPPWWDTVDISYPDGVTEIFTYSIHLLETDSYDIQAIIKVTYTDISKSDISRVIKTYNKDTAR